MKTIQEIDKNLSTGDPIRTENVKVYDTLNHPFKTYGLIAPNDKDDKYRRLPEEVAKSVNYGVFALHANTAGGRIRFATDSEYIAINVEYPTVGKMSHFPLTGSVGFDMYMEFDGVQRKMHTFVPPFKIEDSFSNGIDLKTCSYYDGKKMHEITINFPPYSEVSKVYVILEDDARVEEPRPYKFEKPVVYYGSSSTQGACASRPGNVYQAILSRRLDCNFVNLGFSGKALGEPQMAEYIANLDMSVFFCDYDYNAPNSEHLRATHANFVKIIRDKNPTLPIICVSRKGDIDLDTDERTEIVRQTVENARENGDKNIYFVDVCGYMRDSLIGDGFSVDRSHPNDLGFWGVANAVEETLKICLESTI